MDRIRALNFRRKAMHKSKRPTLPEEPPTVRVPDTDGDLRALASTIVHHDAEIVNLSSRMTGVETGLQVLAKDTNAGFAGVNDTMNSRFSEILQKISDQRLAQGPGWGPILGGGSAMVGILGAVCYAIMLLVNSNVAPPLTKMETQLDEAKRSLDRAAEQDRRELEQYRQGQRAEIDQRIDSLDKKLDQIGERLNWQPSVQSARR